jgi:heme-degrading monooxygenase HmoA
MFDDNLFCRVRPFTSVVSMSRSSYALDRARRLNLSQVRIAQRQRFETMDVWKMITKSINVFVKPGHLQSYLAAQAVWNRETRRAEGYLGEFVGHDPNAPDVVHLNLYWQSREDLARFMTGDHDRIAELAMAHEHYDRIEVRVLEESLPAVLSMPSAVPSVADDAATVQRWGEAYRAAAALRIAVQLGIFDMLDAGPRDRDVLSAKLGVDANMLERLLPALSTMGLTSYEDGRWRNTPFAERVLVKDAPGYQGDMVLHSTQPAYIQRAFGFCETLGLPPFLPEPDAFLPGFLKALANTAAAGQADGLVNAVDLTGCARLLDVGGATGQYAIALCRAYPSLRATIIDQPQTQTIAEPILANSGLGDRIEIKAHDYRRGRFPGPVDVVLLSNVLRGETPEMIDDILGRVYEVLTPGGLVLIPDLYLADPPERPDLSAALFGVHLPGGANYSTGKMISTVGIAGFETITVQPLSPTIVMNALVQARRP